MEELETTSRRCDCSNKLSTNDKSRDKATTISSTVSNGPSHSMTSQRTISVQAEGEVECPPDQFTLTLSITNIKQKLDEAQSSVKRRTNYILQVLRNHGYSDKHVHVYEEVSRCEGGGEHHVKCVVTIEGGEMERMIRVKNTLIEKMDPSVTYSSIRCYHSATHKAKKREESFKAAVVQAKSKAQSVSQSLGVQLGSILTLTEEGLIEREEKQHVTLDHIVDFNIVSYVSSISTVFEVLSVRKKK